MTLRQMLCLLAVGIISFPGISAASTLTGKVVDAVTSVPIRGATVSVDVLIPDSISFHTSSDTTGMYSLSELPGGNAIYVIRCYTYGFAPFYMRYDALALGDRQVDILMYPQPAEPPGGGGDSTDVSGTVFCEAAGGARNPVEQAMVILRAGGIELSSLTGADGRYSLRVRKGSYTLNVQAPNYKPLTTGGVAVDSAGLVLNVLLTSTTSSMSSNLTAGVESFNLESAYPNPFNPSTTIGYALPRRSHVTLAIFNALGQRVATLINADIDAGYHSMQFNASSLGSGVYFYRMQAGGFADTKKFLLIR